MKDRRDTKKVKLHPKHLLDVLNITAVPVYYYGVAEVPLIGFFQEELWKSKDV